MAVFNLFQFQSRDNNRTLKGTALDPVSWSTWESCRNVSAETGWWSSITLLMHWLELSLWYTQGWLDSTLGLCISGDFQTHLLFKTLKPQTGEVSNTEQLITKFCWETFGPDVHVDATWHAPSTSTLHCNRMIKVIHFTCADVLKKKRCSGFVITLASCESWNRTSNLFHHFKLLTFWLIKLISSYSDHQ